MYVLCFERRWRNPEQVSSILAEQGRLPDGQSVIITRSWLPWYLFTPGMQARIEAANPDLILLEVTDEIRSKIDAVKERYGDKLCLVEVPESQAA